jgi:two-component system OmpR family sensor kinase
MYIRTRLALAVILIMVVVLAGFAVVIYQLTHNNLLSEIEWDVRQRADAIATSVTPASGQSSLNLPKLDVFSTPDTYLQIADPSGKVISSSANLNNRTLPLQLDAVQANQVKEIQLDSVPLYIYGKAIMQGDHVMGYVVVGRSLRTIYLALNRLQGFLYPGAAVTLALAGLLVWLLVWRAMRPLEKLAAVAADIAAAGDHTRRLQYKPSRDEIGRLAKTINGMLQGLEDAYKEVTQVNDKQRAFLADVSHELRTPLTIMLSSLDLIAKVGATDPDFQAEALADMRVETDRMARMVTQLLILARSDAGDMAAHKPVLVSDVVVDACRQARQASNGTPLECDVEPLEGAVVAATPDYLKQLFLILLDNAVKYTPTGGCVKVTGEVDGGKAAITVTDTGIGIPTTDLPRIFDRSYRAENARFRSGVGLGLSIARRISEQHGGKIEVATELGRGSTFTVILPLLNS